MPQPATDKWLDLGVMDLPPLAPIASERQEDKPEEGSPPPTRRLPPLGEPRTWKPERILVIDTESALRWFWYDDKGTNRMMIWVAQWVDSSAPVGRIILPDIVLKDCAHHYVGLPVTDRITALNDLRALWTEAEVIIGHNVRNFDHHTLNGEMMIAQMPPLPKRLTHDTLRDQKKTAKQSRSLGNLLPRVTKDTKKEHVHAQVWERAFNEYEPAALREVWNRCVTDVMGHWELHKTLKSLGWLNPARMT